MLAADSRVTLFSQLQTPQGQLVIPASFDNATKLLHVKGQSHIGAVTYGAGAIGQEKPRTAHSFLPEFESELADASGRLSVLEFATRLGSFFTRQWTAAGMPASGGPAENMVFLVGGYDEADAYGKVFEVNVPTTSTPSERIPMGEFGIVWGGQRFITDRILQGFDDALPAAIFDSLNISPQARPAGIEQHLKNLFTLKIPIQFLPLQDCVDLTVFLIRATIMLQKWLIDVRGVGGAVDVASITRTDGFKPLQVKEIVVESFLGIGGRDALPLPHRHQLPEHQ